MSPHKEADYRRALHQLLGQGYTIKGLLAILKKIKEEEQ